MRAKLAYMATLCALAMPGLALAALGEKVGSVNNDRVTMRAAARPVLDAGNYTVHELSTPAGTTVREFAGPDGTVFAIAWQGPVLPDVRTLLGKYFGQYEEALRNKRGSHRYVAVDGRELVVQSAGHMRAFHGKAYLPQSLPAGVTADQLR